MSTRDGLKRIDEIQEGELVLSKDTETGDTSYKKVLAVYRKSSKEFVNLVFEKEEIKTTPTHLFYVDSVGWKPAMNIKVGEKIVNSCGIIKEIISIRN